MAIYHLLAILLVVFSFGCWSPAGIGVGGKYNDAKTEISKGQGKANVGKAIAGLEYVVVRDPYYKDSLTLLGQAYYMDRRYKDAYQILKRALAVRPDDEIAWITLGLTELRLGQDARGLESLKGGLTLFGKASKSYYRGIEHWDNDGYVRTALRRAVFAVTKGLEDKQRIIQTGERLLAQIEDEEFFANSRQRRDRLKIQD